MNGLVSSQNPSYFKLESDKTKNHCYNLNDSFLKNLNLES